MAPPVDRMPVPMRPEGSIAPMSNPLYRPDPPYTGAWADCAYDPESPGWIHHPDQICVLSTIDEVIRLYTKALLREQPDDANLVEWSRAWFEARVAERAAAAAEAPPS